MRFSLSLLTAPILAAVLMTAAFPAHAADPRLISTSGAWSAYVFVEDGNKVCYMASTPEKSSGDYKVRGEVFALVTHRPSEGTKNVFSYIAGYAYKPGSNVTVTIDNKKFTLFTQDDTAWTPDSDMDQKLSEAMRKGTNMVIRGTSARGTQTSDTFSLKGSGSAHDAISQECGIR